MNVFGNYSLYYDLLYKDKDYEAEVSYISGLIKKYTSSAKSLLELGCGTGKHAILLAQKGFDVHGVDVSKTMLKEAENRTNKLPASIKEKVKYSLGDVRTIRLNQAFDVVTSLFHVMSYQTTNEDLQAAFETAKLHLKSGGIFIFDCWYGPAVLTERPENRIKILENENVQVERTANPVMHPNENIVDVNYKIDIRNKIDGTREELTETHKMRYLFKPEIISFLHYNDFDLLHCEEWLSGKELGFNTWGACWVGLKR